MATQKGGDGCQACLAPARHSLARKGMLFNYTVPQVPRPAFHSLSLMLYWDPVLKLLKRDEYHKHWREYFVQNFNFVLLIKFLKPFQFILDPQVLAFSIAILQSNTNPERSLLQISINVSKLCICPVGFHLIQMK